MEMDEVCRTCLRRGEDLYPLFDESLSLVAPGAPVVNFINIFTEFMISRIDGFPERICISCITEVRQAYAFKLKCENAEASLHHLQQIHGRLNYEDICNIPAFESAGQTLELDLSKPTFSESCPDENMDGTDDNDIGITRSIMDFLKIEPEDSEYQENNYVAPEETIETLETKYSSCEEYDRNDYEEIGSEYTNVKNFAEENDEDRKFVDLLACSACPETFKERIELKTHIVDYHTDETLCILCNKVYESDMWSHVDEHLPAEFQCSECDSGFDRRYLLYVHLKSHMIPNVRTGKYEFKCEICSRGFPCYTDFLSHKKIHTGERPFNCDICGMAFRLKDNLRCHMTTHSEERPYKCELCASSFKRKDKLKSHVNFVHDVSGEFTFNCEICNKRFRYKAKLQNHMRVHGIEVDRSVECEICKKTFPAKEELKLHMITHKQKGPFSCTLCNSVFKRKTNLASHVQFVHANIGNRRTSGITFHCSICKKIFHRKDRLKLHMTSHSEERPFECNLCGTKFKRKDGLVRHMKNQHPEPNNVIKQELKQELKHEIIQEIKQELNISD